MRLRPAGRLSVRFVNDGRSRAVYPGLNSSRGSVTACRAELPGVKDPREDSVSLTPEGLDGRAGDPGHRVSPHGRVVARNPISRRPAAAGIVALMKRSLAVVDVFGAEAGSGN